MCAGGIDPLNVLPSPKFQMKLEPAGLVLVKVTDCGAHPIAGLAVNEGTGSGSMVICCEVLDEHPSAVFCDVRETV